MQLLSHLSQKQWSLLGILGLWLVFGSYWYTCNIKYLCKNTPIAPVVSVNTSVPNMPVVLGDTTSTEVSGTPAESLVRQTPEATWNALIANPVLVYFGVNNDNVITENVDSVLKNIVSYLSQNEGQRIVVTGHTNAHPNDAYAVALGLERAHKVKELLVSYGAPASAILVASLGDTQLAAPATTLANQALNRRAVISVARPDAYDIKY
ncbi:MAG: OmpA family protein [Minisyncoccia bacterium]